jgi:hypothetical protein
MLAKMNYVEFATIRTAGDRFDAAPIRQFQNEGCLSTIEPQEPIENAIEMVRNVVDQFRELLRAHLTELHTTTVMTEHATIPLSKASLNPQHTARIHRLAGPI